MCGPSLIASRLVDHFPKAPVAPRDGISIVLVREGCDSAVGPSGGTWGLCGSHILLGSVARRVLHIQVGNMPVSLAPGRELTSLALPHPAGHTE